MSWKGERDPESNSAWAEKLTRFKSSPDYRTLDKFDGEPMEFEWNIFPGFATLQLCNKVQEFTNKMSDQPEEFTGRIISWSPKTMKRNANQALSSSLSLRKDCHQDNGHSSDLDQKRNDFLLSNTNHKENGTELQSK